MIQKILHFSIKIKSTAEHMVEAPVDTDSDKLFDSMKKIS